MIERVLEAYESRTAGDKTFWNKVKRMDNITRVLFWAIIIISILVFGLSCFIQTYIMFGIVVLYGILVYVVTLFLEKIRHKKWETNIEEYHKDLNELADVLKDEKFKLYEKNKIKQLICKYNQSIERQETIESKKKGSLKEFIWSYIIPVVAFISGKLDVDNSSNVEWVSIGIIVVIFIATGKNIYSSVIELKDMISWNQLEKEKYIVLKLQDLLDRDFPIENDDLLKK